MGTELYQWQEECLGRWFANQGRGIVQAVTGSGKTLFALTAAGRLDGKLGGKLRVKIVVPTGVLMRQWNRALREFLTTSGEGASPERVRSEIGLRGGGYQAPQDCKYMIYVINSARYELARRILAELRRGESVLLIADECHHYGSGQNRLIFEFLPYINSDEGTFYSLGLTATLPGGETGRYLASVLGRSIYSYGMADAAAGRTVCRYEVFHIGLCFRPEERAEYEEMSERMSVLYRRLVQAQPLLNRLGQRERYELLRRLAGDGNRKLAEAASRYMGLSYKRKSLVCLAGARISCARELMKRLDPGEKILIFGERIRQAEELYRFLAEQYPGRVGRYHSRMGQQANRNALERFRTGELRILIACKAVDEGVDVPDASVAVILSGTGAQRQRIQRLGRILRKKGDSNVAALYYFHIEESSEDSCFLPDGGETALFELTYDPDSLEFANPVYDTAAERALARLRREGAGTDAMEEAVRCLRQGQVRGDWKRSQEELDRQIAAAGHVGERNYWICMKRVASGSG